MSLPFLLVIAQAAAGDSLAVELAAADRVRGFVADAGVLYFDPRILVRGERLPQRRPEHATSLARVARAELAAYESRVRRDNAAGRNVLVDRRPIFTLGHPIFLGDSVQIRVWTLQYGSPSFPSYAWDFDLVFRRVDGRWVVIGLANERRT